MTITPLFKEFVEELFAPAYPVRIKRMFGGAGIFSGDVMIGLVSEERIFLKTNEETRPAFEAENCTPFVFTLNSGNIVASSYLELPDRLYDDPEELREWALKALVVALDGKKEKPGKVRIAAEQRKVSRKTGRKRKTARRKLPITKLIG